MYRLYIAFLFICLIFQVNAKDLPYLKVSTDGHFLETSSGSPFFWLGDTGWLIAQKLNHQDVEKYLDDRKAKGFNVIQMMALHDLSDANYYNDTALIQRNLVAPRITIGGDFGDFRQYDYWDNIGWVVNECAKREIYVAVVPLWGSVVKDAKPSKAMIRVYMNLLCRHLSNKSNVIWVCGGDIEGDHFPELWDEMADAIKTHNKRQLITFHPRGRTQSSTWFQNSYWLDFNMVQSGHKDYEQDATGFGEDNWKYIQIDYNKAPTKPTIDAEPVYEAIPHGLKDSLAARWTANDVRRYAYWSVFAGACGFTYGHNSIMQFYEDGDKGSFGVNENWFDVLNAHGAYQMHYLKNLILSKPYYERVPDQSMVVGNGERYDYVAATRGQKYAFFYTYNGREFSVEASVLKAKHLKATWLNPRNGYTEEIGVFDNHGILNFNPPGLQVDGNDWVLILEKD